MSIIRNILVRVGADVNPLQDSMGQARRSMENFQSGMNVATSSTRSSMSSIGTILGRLGGLVAAAFAVNKLIDFGKSSIELASNLNEVQNVVDVTFGGMANQINQFAKTAITQFGLSELSAKKYASTIGAMMKSSGLSGQQLVDMSEGITGLSADMASFYNLSQQDAFSKIQSGLSGEVEPLRQLGINMTVANLQAYAMSQGIKTNVKDMTQAQQTLLRYNYLLSVTKDAQGDFARTSNSWANQTRLLNQQWDIIKTTLGQAFINMLTPLLSVINAVIAKLQIAAAYFKAFTEVIFGSTGVVSAVAAPTAGATDGLNAMGNAADNAGSKVKKAASAVKGSLASFDQLNVLGKKSSSSDASDSEGLGLAGGVGSVNLGSTTKMPSIDTTSLDNFKEKVKSTADAVKIFFADVKQFIVEHQAAVTSAVAGMIAAFASFVIITHWTEIVTAFGEALDSVITVFAGLSLGAVAVVGSIGLLVAAVVDLWQTNQQFRGSVVQTWTELKVFMTKVVTDIWTIIKQTWDTYGAEILKGLQGFWDNTKTIILDAWTTVIQPLIKNALESLQQLWDNHLKGLVSVIADFVAKVIEDALEIYNKFIAPLVDWLIKTLGPTFVSVLKIIGDNLSTFLGAVADIAKGVLEVLGGIIDFITGVFTLNWSKAWQGVKEIFAGIFDGILGILKGVVNSIIDAVNFLIRGLDRIHFDMPDWVPDIGGESFGINISQIPKLATGGLAYGPTLAMVGDNRNAYSDPEVVSPLSKLQDMLNKTLANMVGSNPGNGGGDTTVVLKVGETELGRVAIKSINSVHRQVGMTLLTV